MPNLNIRVGGVVVAIKPGGHDREGLPMERPVVGRHYRITSIYTARYGLGCTLQGMNPYPYKGYFLRVNRRRGPVFSAEPGWYFRPIETADTEWTETLYDLLRSKKHESVE